MSWSPMGLLKKKKKISITNRSRVKDLIKTWKNVGFDPASFSTKAFDFVETTLSLNGNLPIVVWNKYSWTV